ncbi:MAG: cytochrome b/b6 domain-containing protein [Candidatus Manganitrophus sp. SA1]|nr:cytochrome b/b6 domain-containing protein [Candidatus Manganitrophus morganii]
MGKADGKNQDPTDATGPGEPLSPPVIRSKTAVPERLSPAPEVFRHPFFIRLTHWINALCLLMLVISGFQIYTGRQWLFGRWHHFLFAWIFSFNGLAYVAYSLVSGHLLKNLFPGWSDFRKIGSTLRDTLFFRHPKGEEATRYNVLQKTAYTGVVFILGPLILLTGLASSARGEAVFPFLHDLFGARKRAQSIHFNLTILFIAYTALHLLMVILTGFGNNLRSMLTGWYRVPPLDEGNEKEKRG